MMTLHTTTPANNEAHPDLPANDEQIAAAATVGDEFLDVGTLDVAVAFDHEETEQAGAFEFVPDYPGALVLAVRVRQTATEWPPLNPAGGFEREEKVLHMIGLWIVIAAQAPEERDAAATEARRAAIIAQWEVGPGGIDWVAELVEAGKVNQISGGGYPNRYTAKAGDVLPHLTSGPPAHVGPAIIGDDYVMPANWRGKVEVHSEKMATSAPDRLQTIDVWDRS